MPSLWGKSLHLFIFISSIACQIAGVQSYYLRMTCGRIKEKYPCLSRDFTFTSFWWPRPGLLLLLIWAQDIAYLNLVREKVNFFYQMTSTSISSTRLCHRYILQDSEVKIYDRSASIGRTSCKIGGLYFTWWKYGLLEKIMKRCKILIGYKSTGSCAKGYLETWETISL